MLVKFEESQFNNIFPFYILLNAELNVVSCGDTLKKFFPGLANKPFQANFYIKRPELKTHDFDSLKLLVNQLIIIDCNNPQKTILRGQFEYLADTGQLLFIGSPWFYNIEQVIENKLSLKDFANHDPMIDLLHVLKTQEITTQDLKEVLEALNKQKDDLKKAANEIEDIARFPKQNPDPITRIDLNGKILLENPVAEALSEFIFEEIKYTKTEFWEKIASKLDRNKERQVVEALSGYKTFSFVIVSLPEFQYYNVYGRDITKQKKSEEQIKRLALLASTNKNGVLFTDAAGKIFYVNEGYTKITGFDINDVEGLTPIAVGRHPLTDRNEIRNMVNAFASGKSFNIELVHARKNGGWFWSRCQGQPTFNEKGKVVQYFAMIEDITQEKENEIQLKILSSIAAENTNGVVISDKEGNVEWANKSFERITGYTLDELKGTKPGKYLQGKDTNPETVNYLRKQIRAGEPFVCEILNYHKSGRPYWLRIQGQALKDQDGKIVKYFAIEEDITEEKETRKKLQQFDEKLRLALELIGDNFWEYDFRTNKTYFSNPNNIFIGEFSDNEADNNDKWWSRIHPEDLHLLVESDKKMRNGDIDYHILEYRMVQTDGTNKWVLDRGVVIEKDIEGKPLKLVGTHTDITELKNAEQIVKRKEEKYRNIIANMNLGLLEVDNEDRIQFANQRFCEMSGYQPEELLGKVAHDLFVRGEEREVVKTKNESRKRDISDVYEVSVYNKKGEEMYWLISGAPNYNDSGENVGSIGIHLDITEQKKLEEELIKAKELAEASTKAKEKFLANMSHEIRTPMNAIMGMSNQLVKTKLDTSQQFFLKTIQTAADNLIIILNDILDLSKIEAGELTIQNVGFEPGTVISEVMRVMEYKAQEKGLSFTNSFCDPNLSPVLMGDPYRLNQILLNIVSNAIKYTEKGEVDIACRVIEDKPLAQKIELRVRDTGIGMDEIFISKIFDKFSQEYTPGARFLGGTGLGMSISKELIDLMGGNIHVESTKGKGTSVVLYLELEKGDFSNLPKLAETNLSFDVLKNKKIVVADDNIHNRLVASIIIKNRGAVVFEAENGKEAIQLAVDKNADLILMDLQMPVLNGYEATKMLREREFISPIIALTANAIKGEKEKCIEAGMDDYIAKPFTENELLKTVSIWLDQKPNPDLKPVENKTIRPELEERLYDISTLKSISRDNDIFIRKMVNLFCEQTPPLLEEMKNAYRNNDLKTMGALAHRIKPSLDNLHIHSLKQDIRLIENAGKENNALPNLSELILKTEQVLKQVIQNMKTDYP